MPFAEEPTLRKIDLSKYEGRLAKEVTVVAVPLPKGTVAVVFGQRTAEWLQRFNAYLVDENGLVQDPQTVWHAPSDQGRFAITDVKPTSLVPPDPHVFSYGPYEERYDVAIYAAHQKPGSTDFKPSDPKHSSHAFKIGKKDAIKFTMVNAEDGGDSDYHDTVVGVSVNYLTK